MSVASNSPVTVSPVSVFSSPISPHGNRGKPYDYVLKFLLVGDSDVGKEEIIACLDNGCSESPYGFSNGVDYKTTILLLEGKRVKLQLWDTSGQGRFCTIFRSYSRGAQGILLVYDITNRWSFDGLDRWIMEVNEHAPGVPKILIGNRLHLAFKREVSEMVAEAYAVKHDMAFFEVSPLCDFNVTESLAELSRTALKRNGMTRSWGPNTVFSLQELCCRTIAAHSTIYSVDHLPLPTSLKAQLKSYLIANKPHGSRSFRTCYNKHKKPKIILPSDSPTTCRNSCVIS